MRSHFLSELRPVFELNSDQIERERAFFPPQTVDHPRSQRAVFCQTIRIRQHLFCSSCIDIVNKNLMELDQRERLRSLIRQWNENRLDLFSISEPNENMEFYGVMRFYYHEPGQKVTTKCIRVSSSATTRTVIDALVEKFHPDMKMLTDPDYSIWELHENSEERMLELDERPLLVQLSWHQSNREGRFLLKSTDQPVYLPFSALQFGDEVRSSKRSNKFKKKGNGRDKGWFLESCTYKGSTPSAKLRFSLNFAHTSVMNYVSIPESFRSLVASAVEILNDICRRESTLNVESGQREKHFLTITSLVLCGKS
uniref:Ras-associating domain-containing protein n=1 Tax=Bursaphelenchus xylophilus TaxID=6326 RepID=A0A1I7RM40_BURXY